MPEDATPELKPGTSANVHYFTLPMALNYQRNSSKLWEAAPATWRDAATNWVFDPRKVVAVVVEPAEL